MTSDLSLRFQSPEKENGRDDDEQNSSNEQGTQVGHVSLHDYPIGNACLPKYPLIGHVGGKGPIASL